MSLKQKISEQAKPLYQWIQESYIDAPPPTFSSEQKVLVSVDVVCGLLDKAIMEIEKKAFRQGVGYWENAVMLADVQKILLGVVEAEQK